MLCRSGSHPVRLTSGPAQPEKLECEGLLTKGLPQTSPPGTHLRPPPRARSVWKTGGPHPGP